MEMLTEVMSLMLLNKNDQVVKYAGNLEKIDADAKLPHPSTLSNKRRAKKRLNADKAETESLDKTLRSEKQASKEKSWEHKQARLSKAKSFEERLAEYEARQKNLAKLEQSRSIQRL